MSRYVNKMVAILFGSIVLAAGINFFLVPFRILDGGIIGLALIANYLTGAKVGFLTIMFSLPIFLYAWFKYRSFFYNSIVGMLMSSFFIDLLYPYLYHFTYYVRMSPEMSAILGGGLVGLGIGTMLRNNTSISGADMLAQILANILKINVGIVIFVIDALVIGLGGFLISIETFYLSILAIFAVGVATSLVTINHKFCNESDHQPNLNNI